jgi:Trk K+ transport system NAD-binding subunit
MGHLTDHVVICNWNEQANRIVETIHPEMFDESDADWFPVVIVANNVVEFPDSDRFEDTLLVPGSPLNARLLRRANVQDAHTVIILADRNLEAPDDQTLQIALLVRSIIESERRFREKEPRIVAEVLDSRRAPNFRRQNITGIHEVVCETDLSVRVLAQTNLSPGLTYLLGDILEYDANENDIYMVPVPAHWRLVGETLDSFARLVDFVGSNSLDQDNNRPALLLGLRRQHVGRPDEMLVNPTAARLKEFGPLEQGDVLVMLARNPEHARMAVAAEAGGASA